MPNTEPNVYSNIMFVYGPPEDVKDLGEFVKSAYTDYITSGKPFFDALFEICGYDAEPSNETAYELEIEYTYEPDADGESNINFHFATYRTSMCGVFDAFLAAKFPTLKQVTLADDFEHNVFINTDSRRKYFPWNHIVAYEHDFIQVWGECFKTLADAETFFHETFGADVPFSRDYVSDEKREYFHVYDFEAM